MHKHIKTQLGNTSQVRIIYIPLRVWEGLRLDENNVWARGSFSISSCYILRSKPESLVYHEIMFRCPQLSLGWFRTVESLLGRTEYDTPPRPPPPSLRCQLSPSAFKPILHSHHQASFVPVVSQQYAHRVVYQPGFVCSFFSATLLFSVRPCWTAGCGFGSSYYSLTRRRALLVSCFSPSLSSGINLTTTSSSASIPFVRS